MHPQQPKPVEPVSREELDRIEYLRKVESMLSQKHKQPMIQMLEMGYSNFNENEVLVRQFDGQME